MWSREHKRPTGDRGLFSLLAVDVIFPGGGGYFFPVKDWSPLGLRVVVTIRAQRKGAGGIADDVEATLEFADGAQLTAPHLDHATLRERVHGFSCAVIEALGGSFDVLQVASG